MAGLLQSTPLLPEEVTTLQGLVDSAWAAERLPAEPSIALPCEVNRILFSAGLAVHAATAVLQSGDASAVENATQKACHLVDEAIEKVSEAFEVITTSFRASESGTALPLDSSTGTALAGPLLTEESAWTAACISSWISLLKNVSLPDTSSGAKPKLLDALAAAAVKVRSALTSIDAQLVAIRDTPAAPAATRTLDELEETWQVGRLWNYESEFKASKVLQEILEEQIAVVGRLHTAVAKSLGVLKPLAK